MTEYSILKDKLFGELYNAIYKENKVILVCGPTAGGKSAIADEIADKFNGIVINSDSMQVFKDIPTLTARPYNTKNSLLYAFLEPNDKFSVFKWVKMCAQAINKAKKLNKTPIIVGGTGFYFQTLTQGISPVPETTEEIRKKVKEKFLNMGEETFKLELKSKCPDFNFSDTQRMIRAMEVFEQTAISITKWQEKPAIRYVDANFYGIYVNPIRETLYDRCNKRFLQMIKSNSLMDEIDELMKKNPNENSLIMNAIGLKDILNYREGKTSLEEAISHSQQLTRNYAKRQVTWFNHRFNADFIIS
ncbi:MAG: tRNA (adenosine(37)-N6)-dimethylallyltransferase MiaA [Alphaproteobacteria bacterium]|nr:tRNA (adenosine(37)-N6)-dimethylallyltransferase MiaA [Alphaproteobacteria bacterium]